MRRNTSPQPQVQVRGSPQNRLNNAAPGRTVSGNSCAFSPAFRYFATRQGCRICSCCTPNSIPTGVSGAATHLYVWTLNNGWLRVNTCKWVRPFVTTWTLSTTQSQRSSNRFWWCSCRSPTTQRNRFAVCYSGRKAKQRRIQLGVIPSECTGIVISVAAKCNSVAERCGCSRVRTSSVGGTAFMGFYPIRLAKPKSARSKKRHDRADFGPSWPSY